ncbi:MAG: hypothetical protein ABIJ20_02095 [Nanoarchaeota archaeon]|nr:hypothetical protein [Nanoarchaeota archaeon]MBU1445286.1 hypothetical protein [Nanoarchaeota archaeon]MBU2420482.1 hypothetical protein [Nanoarchaeota archaeon]MBU2475093.1 hypothetical protein [Nanoarchaeota archaeon]
MIEGLLGIVENVSVMIENPTLIKEKIVYGLIPRGIYHGVPDSSLSNNLQRCFWDWVGNFVKRQSCLAYVNLSDRTFVGESNLGDVVNTMNTIYRLSPIS